MPPPSPVMGCRNQSKDMSKPLQIILYRIKKKKKPMVHNALSVDMNQIKIFQSNFLLSSMNFLFVCEEKIDMSEHSATALWRRIIHGHLQYCLYFSLSHLQACSSGKAERQSRARNSVPGGFTHDERFQKFKLQSQGWKVREIYLGIKDRCWAVKLIDPYYTVP